MHLDQATLTAFSVIIYLKVYGLLIDKFPRLSPVIYYMNIALKKTAHLRQLVGEKTKSWAERF